jgi:hypothetical protein
MRAFLDYAKETFPNRCIRIYLNFASQKKEDFRFGVQKNKKVLEIG